MQLRNSHFTVGSNPSKIDILAIIKNKRIFYFKKKGIKIKYKYYK
jgi:hypothetical protein